MGSLLVIAGDLDTEARQARLQAMARRSPYRGSLRTLHLHRLSIGIQRRDGDASLHDTGRLVVAVHGRVYRSGGAPSGSPERSCAELIATEWERLGRRCLDTLDGEYSLVVHDRRAGTTLACVSLSMTRPLYWCAAPGVSSVASEMRQAAAGARLPMRLDPEQLVQSLCFGGPVLDTQCTEYAGLSRLVAPRLYGIDTHAPEPRPVGDYWVPPATEPLSAAERSALPGRLLGLLATTIESVPGASGWSLSGGYDSGTLWAAAHRPGRRARGLKGYGLVFPGNAANEERAIRRLLHATDTRAALIRCEGLAPSDYLAAHLRDVDLIPRAGTLFYLDVIGQHMRADGVTCHVTGIGAEAWLSAGADYAADLLRQGRWRQLVTDASRFEHYDPRQLGQAQRLLRFAKRTIAPPGSRLQRLRRRPPPAWLHARWHDLFREAARRLDATAAREGYGRGRAWSALEHYAVGSGLEAVEQLTERDGLELYCPYLHRAIAEFGFRTPAAEINLGRHPKHLLRRCAETALAAPAPWPSTKMVHTAVIAHDHALTASLGPPAAWRLGEIRILAPERYEGDWGQPRGMALSYAEHYLRHHGC